MLSDTKARSMQPGGKALAGGVPGLWLFPSNSRGRGKWILRFVSPVTRKRRDLGLGPYPEVGIAAARSLASQARAQIAAGQDPIQERALTSDVALASIATVTFRVAAVTLHKELAAGFRNRKHAAQWLTTLETYVFPTLGNTVVSDLRSSDFASALRPIWLSTPETASRVRQRCDAVMKWCAARDLIVASPLGVVDRLLPPQPSKRHRVEHHPAVLWKDMPAVYSRLFRSGSTTTAKLLLEFTILTACRSGEARGMRWTELDAAYSIWTIPADRMKARSIHRIPLAPRASSILAIMATQRDGSELVFPSIRNTQLSDMTMTKILRTAKIIGDVEGRTATVHGFRSTFRDWASEHGYPRDLAERALAHTIKNATEAAYHRTDLLDQRRGMMVAWEQWAGGGG